MQLKGIRSWAMAVLLGLTFTAPVAVAEGTRLLRYPDVSDRHITFAYANDIWVADRDGGEARRLTTFPGSESFPHFSPDGKWIAFSGQYDGNTDVYVVPIEGGAPARLTHHPGQDQAFGWSADGKNVLFISGRASAPVGYGKLFEIPVGGGFPVQLPVPRIWDGQLNADGSMLAYAHARPSDIEWRNYRGGQAQPIWVLDMTTEEVTKLPWEGSMDTFPVWSGNKAPALGPLLRNLPTTAPDSCGEAGEIGGSEGRRFGDLLG